MAEKDKRYAHGKKQRMWVTHILWRCPDCGRVFVKRRRDDDGNLIATICCNTCGAEYPIPPSSDLRGIRAVCECGRILRWMTNIDGQEYIEHACHRCGTPIYMAYNPVKRCYYSPGEEAQRGRK